MHTRQFMGLMFIALVMSACGSGKPGAATPGRGMASGDASRQDSGNATAEQVAAAARGDVSCPADATPAPSGALVDDIVGVRRGGARHTPGPWTYLLQDDGETAGVTFVIRLKRDRFGWEPQHRIEYEVPSREESPLQFAEAEANVRLIVASPKLLAAAQLALAAFDRIGHDIVGWSDEYAALRAAVAAAEGSDVQ